MSNRFVNLKDSAGVGANFRVAYPSKPRQRHRLQSTDRAADGTADIAQGGNFLTFEYVIRVRETETEEGMGDLDELIRLWSLNNPGGTPTDKITLVDNYGDTYTVVFKGELPETPLTTIIEGAYAWYFIPVNLMEV